MGKHENKEYGQPELLGWLGPGVRAWLYGVLACAVPLLIAYGVIDQTTAPLWLALGGSVLGFGTAYLHTPIQGQPGPNASSEGEETEGA